MVKLKVNMVKVETVERFCDGVARLELSAEVCLYSSLPACLGVITVHDLPCSCSKQRSA